MRCHSDIDIGDALCDYSADVPDTTTCTVKKLIRLESDTDPTSSSLSSLQRREV